MIGYRRYKVRGYQRDDGDVDGLGRVYRTEQVVLDTHTGETTVYETRREAKDQAAALNHQWRTYRRERDNF